MVLVISRVILFVIIALALGITTVFPQQKLPLYIIYIVCSGRDCYECMVYPSKY